MTTIITADKARELIASVHDLPLVEHKGDVWRDDAGDLKYVGSFNRLHPGYKAIFIAAPSLAATVIRLHAILACERGESAPEGWTRVSTFDCEWENHRTDMRVDNLGPGEWQAFRWSGQHDYTVGDPQPTALEAIEQADDYARRVYAKEPA